MTPEKAKDELAKMDIAFTEEAFLREAWKGDVGTVQLFLQADMQPNALDQKGNTALSVAAKEGHLEVVSLLLERGADTEIIDIKFGGTPLIWAALRGQTETAGLLLEKGANINAVEEKNGMNAVILAAVKGHSDTVKLLVEKRRGHQFQRQGWPHGVDEGRLPRTRRCVKHLNFKRCQPRGFG